MLFKDCLCFLVGRVARKMTKVTREKIAPYGITTSQFFLLNALYEEDGVLISALAHKVALDKGTLTGVLDRLERDDFIERRADPSDRRAIRIYLKQKAEEMKENLIELYHENNNAFLSLLTEDEKLVFETVVEKLENGCSLGVKHEA